MCELYLNEAVLKVGKDNIYLTEMCWGLKGIKYVNHSAYIGAPELVAIVIKTPFRANSKEKARIWLGAFSPLSFLLLVAIQKQWEQFGRILYGTREEIWSNPGYLLESPGEHLKKYWLGAQRFWFSWSGWGRQVFLGCGHWLKPLV